MRVCVCICVFVCFRMNVDSLVLFGVALWHINHCRLFNAKSILYT